MDFTSLFHSLVSQSTNLVSLSKTVFIVFHHSFALQYELATLSSAVIYIHLPKVHFSVSGIFHKSNLSKLAFVPW
jgi:hypothetical protein